MSGQQRLRKYYDMELQSVRKVFRLCLREFVDLVLARKKAGSGWFMDLWRPVLKSSLGGDVRLERGLHHQPVLAFMIVWGCIFDKLVPVFETAEKMWLKAGLAAHCGNIKTLLGLLDSGILPNRT